MNPTKAEPLLGQLTSKALGWLLPALAGAILTVLLSWGKQQAQVEGNSKRLDKIEAEVSALSTTYATNKRVDDVVEEMRGSNRNLESKLDNLTKILVDYIGRRK